MAIKNFKNFLLFSFIFSAYHRAATVLKEAKCRHLPETLNRLHTFMHTLQKPAKNVGNFISSTFQTKGKTYTS